MSFSTGIDSLLSLSAIPASTAGCVLEQDVVEKPSRSLPQSSPEKKEYGFAHGEIRVVIFTQDEHCDLRDLLECESGMRVVATSKSNDALAMIEKHHPELAVFDIGTEGNSAMSPLNSYRLSKKNSSIDTPMTLLVAPDMTYLYQAFEFRAVDFLLRPLHPLRLRQAMDRIRDEFTRMQYIRLGQQMLGLFQGTQSSLKTTGQLAFRVNGRLVFVHLDDIDWIEASANYVQVNAGSESYLVRETIGRISSRLDSEKFVRIHRSVIVNVRRIKELESCNAGEYIAILKSGKKLPCSRGFRPELEKFISRCMRPAR
jgi:two-component system LytT family response regulator